MTAEPGSWWLVLLDGLAGQAARVAEADRGRAAMLATVSHDLRAPLAAAKAHLAASLLDVSRRPTGSGCSSPSAGSAPQAPVPASGSASR